MKPSIFIGSSSEALPLAKSIKEALMPEFESELWKDNLFSLGEDNLENLLRFVKCYDCAILVLTEDDFIKSRGVEQGSPRDNVILELGLFMGALGRRRSFPIVAKGDGGTPKIPSDLLGNTAVYLPYPAPSGADLTEALAQLITTIRERSKESFLHLLPSTALAIGYFQNFLLPVCQRLAQERSINLNGQEIDLSKGNFDFTIVLPKTLSDSSTHGAAKFARTSGVAAFQLPHGARSYPFFVRSDLQEGRVVFYDYPTTLNASHRAISLALHRDSLGVSDIQRRLDAKEIANFKRTIITLLQEPEAAEFRDNVKFTEAP